MIHKFFDYGLAILIGLIAFMRYLAGPEFFPDEITGFLVERISYMGFSATPRVFWIGVFLIVGSLVSRFIEKGLSETWELRKSDGKKYLEKHDID